MDKQKIFESYAKYEEMSQRSEVTMSCRRLLIRICVGLLVILTVCVALALIGLAMWVIECTMYIDDEFDERAKAVCILLLIVFRFVVGLSIIIMLAGILHKIHEACDRWLHGGQ